MLSDFIGKHETVRAQTTLSFHLSNADHDAHSPDIFTCFQGQFLNSLNVHFCEAFLGVTWTDFNLVDVFSQPKRNACSGICTATLVSFGDVPLSPTSLF